MSRPSARTCRTTEPSFGDRNPGHRAALAAVPWLRPLGSDAADFAFEVYRALAIRVGTDVDFDIRAGTARLSDGETLSFGRLARRAARSRPAEWPALIRGHLETTLVSARDLFEELCGDVDAATLRLRRRLIVPSAWTIDDDLVSTAITSGLHAAVVLDLDDGCGAVAACHLDGWGITDDEAWQLARVNDDRDGPWSGREGDTADDGLWTLDDGVWVLDGDGFITGTALRLDEVLPIEAPGALVTAPNANQLLVAQLPDLDADGSAAAIPRLLTEVATFAGTLLPDHAAPLSRDILWFRPGLEIPLVGVFDASTESLIAPEPLRAVLVR